MEAATSQLPALRTSDEIAEQIRLARIMNEALYAMSIGPESCDSTFMDGVIAALEWVQGGGDAPLE